MLSANSVRSLSKSILRDNSLSFCEFVASAGSKILIIFSFAAWPGNDHAFNAVTFSQPEGKWKFGLRKITGSGFNHSRLRQF